MPFVKIGEIVQARDFGHLADSIFCAKKIALDLSDSYMKDTFVLLSLDGVYIAITPTSNEVLLLDAWRRAYLLEEYDYTLPTSFGKPKPLVIDPEVPERSLLVYHELPSDASHTELTRWRHAFISELYIELRDNASPDTEPCVGWPDPGSFDRGFLLVPDESKETSVMEVNYHFIIFWAKLVQKMTDEGTPFEEAALEGARKTHLTEVDYEEARSILSLIKTHLTQVWDRAQELYDWYSSWVNEAFPQVSSPGIPEWLR